MDPNKTFKFSIYLTVFAGVLAIVSAEETVFYLFLFLIAAVLSWFLVDKNEIAYLPDRPTIFLLCLCLLFWAFDLWAISHEFFLSLEHLFVLLLIVNLFRRKTPDVLLQIYLLSFMLVLNSAGITPNLSFLVVLLYYLTISTFSLSLFFIKREHEHMLAALPRKPRWGMDLDMLLSRRFFNFTLVVSLMILFFSCFFFLSIPRFHLKRLGANNATDPTTLGSAENPIVNPLDGSPMPSVLDGSGFPGGEQPGTTGISTGLNGDTVNAVKKDFAPVMIIQLSLDGQPVTERDERISAYIRALSPSLDAQPDFRSLSKQDLADDTDRSADGWITVASLQGPVLEQTIKLWPNGAGGFIPAFDTPVAFELPVIRGLYNEWGYGFLDKTEERGYNPSLSRSYKVRSVLVEHAPNELFLDTSLNAHYQQSYYRMPAGVDSTRIKTLAGAIAKDLDNDYERIKAIEAYLEKNYKYTLDRGRTQPGVNYIDDFLFKNPQGWCEHFSSSMVVLCRALGYPARAVGGFRGGSWQSNALVILRSHAHAWVEVYFKNAGWVRFDPTPPDERIRTPGVDSPDNPELTPYKPEDKAKTINENEIPSDQANDDKTSLGDMFKQYDHSRQVGIISSAWQSVKNALSYGAQLLSGAWRWAVGFNLYQPGYLLAIAGAIALVFSLFAAHSLMERKRVEKQLQRSGVSAQRQTIRVIRFYNELLKMLHPHGMVRKSTQTPHEFASAVLKSHSHLTAVDRITDYYCKARFGGADLQYEELKEIKNLLRAVKTALNRQDFAS